MNAKTEVEMADLLCPQAKLFGEPTGTCHGRRCALFREADLPTDSAWLAALTKLAAEIEDKTPAKVKAAKMILADPEKYGLERVYYCGLGGKP